MPTGPTINRRRKRVGQGAADDLRAVGLRFERGRIIVALSDEREVSVPLELYPTLAAAAPAQRGRWTFISGGVGVHWIDLDLDLSVPGLVNGLREAIPAPPRI